MSPENSNINKKSEKPFNKEAEKEYRKEIKKSLELAITNSLKKYGFVRSGDTRWVREVGEVIQLVKLQRDMTRHSYSVEARMCNKDDAPEGVSLDHVTYKDANRKNMGAVFNEAETESSEDKYYENREARGKALNFEMPGSAEKYSDEYFLPSVEKDEVERKIALVSEMVEHIPRWFDEHDDPV